MAKARTDAQLFEGMSSSDYDVYSSAQVELEAWFEAHPTEAFARAEALCRLALESDSREGRQRVGYTALPLIVASQNPLPAKYDGLISGYGNLEKLRATLLAVPEKRRLAIFVSQLSDSHSASRLVEHLLDLAPDFATPYLRAYFATTGVDGSQWHFGNWRSHARVQKLITEHRAWMTKQPKKPAPPPPPPERKGTLSFVDGVSVMQEDFDGLDAIGKAQYRLAAGAYVGGGSVKDPAHFIRKLEANDLDESDSAMRRWKVMQGDQHLYDFWVVWVDNGTLFEANGKKKLPVNQLQGSFQALKRDAKWVALADDLRRSAPADLWTVKKRRGGPRGSNRR